ncbi:MAG TPA: four helix bundle protein [Bacteroidales bacterium]|nr:four helix bundle protein [Bacteroidales bacterium]
MKNHEDLESWKNSVEFVLLVYHLTKKFPREEIYSLTQQIRRAAVSVPSNISEGAARNQSKEFIRYLRISIGSLAEVDTQLLIAYRLDYLSETELKHCKDLIIRIRIQILGLIKFLENHE